MEKKLLTLSPGDVSLNQFSPTGFYSSAVHNHFLQELEDRSDRQVSYVTVPCDTYAAAYGIGARGRKVYIKPDDFKKIQSWEEEGFIAPLRTPDSTLVFVSEDKAQEIRKDQIDCMGCLSSCRFSNWHQHAPYNTGKKADPRSFCIQKSLQDISHAGSIDNNLMFAGHNVYKFGEDPFYRGGFIPTVKELVDRILTGD